MLQSFVDWINLFLIVKFNNQSFIYNKVKSKFSNENVFAKITFLLTSILKQKYYILNILVSVVKLSSEYRNEES